MVQLFETSRFQNIAITGLRISLGLIFFWFGALKVAGYNPVYEIVYASFPILASGTGNILLGIFETLIGAGLLIDRLPRVINIVLLAHLADTFSVFFTAPYLMFHPYFPILTLAGEFVFKNATLAMAGLTLLAYQRRHV